MNHDTFDIHITFIFVCVLLYLSQDFGFDKDAVYALKDCLS